MFLILQIQHFMGRSTFQNHTEFPYHITARCINRDWFALDMETVWDIMSRHLYFLHIGFNIKIHAFVLMSNHFHLIARSPDANLSKAMGYFMRETSREITFLSGRINQTYGSRFHRSLLDNPLYYLHAYKYVYRNPVTAGVCSQVQEYPFSSLKGLMGERWLDVPICEDENWGSFLEKEKTLAWLNAAPPPDLLEEVRLGLKRSVFSLSPINNRDSKLERYPL